MPQFHLPIVRLHQDVNLRRHHAPPLILHPIHQIIVAVVVRRIQISALRLRHHRAPVAGETRQRVINGLIPTILIIIHHPGHQRRAQGRDVDLHRGARRPRQGVILNPPRRAVDDDRAIHRQVARVPVQRRRLSRERRQVDGGKAAAESRGIKQVKNFSAAERLAPRKFGHGQRAAVVQHARGQVDFVGGINRPGRLIDLHGRRPPQARRRPQRQRAEDAKGSSGGERAAGIDRDLAADDTVAAQRPPIHGDRPTARAAARTVVYQQRSGLHGRTPAIGVEIPAQSERSRSRLDKPERRGGAAVLVTNDTRIGTMVRIIHRQSRSGSRCGGFRMLNDGVSLVGKDASHRLIIAV